MPKNLDSLLAPEQFPELNERFYRGPSSPHWYLRQRYLALLLLTRSPQLEPSDEPLIFKVGELTATFAAEDSDDDTRDDFLAVESTVLLHHAAETLLRLYFAHEGLPLCPWLQVARLRERGSFTARVRDLASKLRNRRVTESIMEVFTGVGRFSQVGSSWPRAEWNDRRDGLVQLLARCTEIVLEGGNLYNSAKHGLTVKAHDVGISFAFPEEVQLDLSAQGPAVTFLESKDGGSGLKWQVSHTWISAASNLGLVYVINQQIESLWNVATRRYVDPEDGSGFHKISPEIVETIERAGWEKKPITIQNMGMPLLYFVDPEEVEQGAVQPDPADG